MQPSGGPVILGGVRDLAALSFSRECVGGRWREGVGGLARSENVGVFVMGFSSGIVREAVENLALSRECFVVDGGRGVAIEPFSRKKFCYQEGVWVS